MNKKGILESHSLWDVWNSISESNKEKILITLDERKAFWDYKSLFDGEITESSLKKGPIDTLTKLLVIDELEVTDILFKKFKDFNSENYDSLSSWGLNWENFRQDFIYRQKKRAELLEIVPSYHGYDLLRPDLVYWQDSHFFITVYSKIVYKLFINGMCDESRFVEAFNFEFNNSVIIHESIKSLNHSHFVNLKNSVFDQYLIFLEKKKDYKKCINLIESIEFSLWANNYSKRYDRAKSKIE